MLLSLYANYEVRLAWVRKTDTDGLRICCCLTRLLEVTFLQETVGAVQTFALNQRVGAFFVQYFN